MDHVSLKFRRLNTLDGVIFGILKYEIEFDSIHFLKDTFSESLSYLTANKLTLYDWRSLCFSFLLSVQHSDSEFFVEIILLKEAQLRSWIVFEIKIFYTLQSSTNLIEYLFGILAYWLVRFHQFMKFLYLRALVKPLHIPNIRWLSIDNKIFYKEMSFWLTTTWIPDWITHIFSSVMSLDWHCKSSWRENS